MQATARGIAITLGLMSTTIEEMTVAMCESDAVQNPIGGAEEDLCTERPDAGVQPLGAEVCALHSERSEGPAADDAELVCETKGLGSSVLRLPRAQAAKSELGLNGMPQAMEVWWPLSGGSAAPRSEDVGGFTFLVRRPALPEQYSRASGVAAA